MNTPYPDNDERRIDSERYRVSSIEYPASSIQHPVSRTMFLTSVVCLTYT